MSLHEYTQMHELAWMRLSVWEPMDKARTNGKGHLRTRTMGLGGRWAVAGAEIKKMVHVHFRGNITCHPYASCPNWPMRLYIDTMVCIMLKRMYIHIISMPRSTSYEYTHTYTYIARNRKRINQKGALKGNRKCNGSATFFAPPRSALCAVQLKWWEST